MTTPTDINADMQRQERKREQRAEFMRAFVVAWMHSGNMPPTIVAAGEARRMWDAIEAEASR
jgi:hypothetical protein